MPVPQTLGGTRNSLSRGIGAAATGPSGSAAGEAMGWLLSAERQPAPGPNNNVLSNAFSIVLIFVLILSSDEVP